MTSRRTAGKTGRRRRGLINGIGYLANDLFGVLDTRFADQYKKDIETIHRNEKLLYNLWKNQSSIIEAEFNLMKRMEITVNKQHKLILKQEAFVSARKRAFSNVKYKIFHTSVTSHWQRCLVTACCKDYKLLKVKARATKKFVIIEVTFPLVSRESYKLYKIIHVPHQTNTNKTTIVPVSEYVAVNLKDSFFSMSTQELTACLHHGTTIMCQLLKPITDLQGDESFCEKNSATNKCKVDKTNCTNV